MNAKALSSAVAKFSAKFCNELDKSKSVVSSPLSAEYLLALLALGAMEPAHSELLTALDIPDNDSIRSSFGAVSAKLKGIKGVTFNVANKIYIKDGSYELVPELKEDAEKVFDAEFEKVDFDNTVGAAELINQWVENKTNEKIKDLFSSDSFNADTRLVLVNALYFMGNWKNQFDAMDTIERPFHIDTQSSVNIPMMSQEGKFKYGESSDLQARLLEMRYEGGDASMVIVLPNEIDGLDGVMQKLTDGYDLMSELEKMRITKVKVILPKFKIETEIDLKEVLPQLGIKAIFGHGDFGLNKILNTGEPLYVSKAVQKVYIDVNEAGAKAAAATGMSVAVFHSAIIGEEMMPYFTADHPFLAVIIIAGTPFLFARHRSNEE
ncbi:serine protease inhibitor 3/4 [Manduca sexta]|uniref:serine protease inhibitor 3/4 n=1 Tax=Manduca sexta TaxID=7130 RepID=UPI00188EE97E|nr:serine protease inhibitor 3/4 [Manduca sexta]